MTDAQRAIDNQRPPGDGHDNVFPLPIGESNANVETAGGVLLDDTQTLRDGLTITSVVETEEEAPLHVYGDEPLLGIPVETFLIIKMHADVVYELERSRIMQSNRLFQFTDEKRGKGFPKDHPTVVAMGAGIDAQRQVEGVAVRQLKKSFDLLPDHVVEFVDGTVGLGRKSVGRWLGTVLNPAWHSREQRPRKIRELYSYCGLGVVNGQAPRRRKGVQSNWNSQARMRSYLMAEPAVKMVGYTNAKGTVFPRSPYRDVYEEAKAKYVERNDARPVDDQLVPAHVQAQAVRIVTKRIVRDLWEVFNVGTEAGYAPGPPMGS